MRDRIMNLIDLLMIQQYTPEEMPVVKNRREILAQMKYEKSFIELDDEQQKLITRMEVRKSQSRNDCVPDDENIVADVSDGPYEVDTLLEIMYKRSMKGIDR